MDFSTARRVRTTAIAVLGILIAGLTAAADDIEDAAKTVRAQFAELRQDEYERTFGARQAKLGQLPFRDQAYGVDKTLSKEPGWDAPEKLFVFKPSTASGPVYACTWKEGRKGAVVGAVTIVVTRYGHADATVRVGDADVPVADALALVKAISRAWSAGIEAPPAPAADAPPPDPGTQPPADPAAKLAAADREACVEAVKKRVGVGIVYAASQGKLTATSKRERREWWAWTGADADWVDGGGKATWVACARYDESVLSKTNPAMTKGAYFMSKVHSYKGVAAK